MYELVNNIIPTYLTILFLVKFRDGTRLFSGIPERRKSPGILEKGKKFWNLEKLKESYNSNF